MSPLALLIVLVLPPISSLLVGFWTPMPTLPVLLTTKRVSPDEEAAKMSPLPDWSTMSVAILVLPLILAVGMVPRLDLMSSVARAVAVLMPIMVPAVRVDPRVEPEKEKLISLSLPKTKGAESAR